MGRRKHQPAPGRHRPIREELARVVAGVGVEPEQGDGYLRFALELYRAFRRSPPRVCYHAAPPAGLRPSETEDQYDFSMGTRRVVRKWFERGLSGKALWAICRAVLAWKFPGLG